MYHLSKFINSSQGRYLMSILLGVGLATLFRHKCQGGRCKIIRAPPLGEVSEKVYKFGDACYQFEPKSTSCNPDATQTLYKAADELVAIVR